jgi:hypothetical protein
MQQVNAKKLFIFMHHVQAQKRVTIVAYRPVARRLCKQQLLLWTSRSLRMRGDVTQQ